MTKLSGPQEDNVVGLLVEILANKFELLPRLVINLVLLY